MSDRNLELAEKIVSELFVNGQNQQADRLVLTTKHGTDLGGWWGRLPAVHVIMRVLEKHLGGAPDA